MALDSIITSYRDELGAESVLIERIPGDSPFSGGTSVSFGRTPMMSGDGVSRLFMNMLEINRSRILIQSL